jgi:hypothetical protein
MRDIDNILPIGGLNLDDDKRVMSTTDSDYRLNVQYETGKSGVLVPMKGNQVVGTVFGTPKGWCEDNDTQEVVVFISSGVNGFIDGATPILGWGQYLFDTSCPHIDARIVEGKLIWTDGITDKKKINIQRARNTYAYMQEVVNPFEDQSLLENEKVYIKGMGIYKALKSFYFYTTDVKEYIDNGFLSLEEDDIYWDIENDVSQIVFIKKPPTSTVDVSEVYNTTDTTNPIVERVLSFSYRYVYKDNEKSVFAKPSRVVFNPYAVGTKEADSFVGVDIKLKLGNEDVLMIEVVMQNVITGNWFKIGEVKNKEFYGQEEYVYRYEGGSIAEPIDNKEVDKAFDAVPLKVGTMCSIDNRIIDGNITEGFTIDNPVVLSVSYLEPGVVGDVFVYESFQTQTDWENAHIFDDKCYFAGYFYESVDAYDSIVASGARQSISVTWVGGEKIYTVEAQVNETVETFMGRVRDVINGIRLDGDIPLAYRNQDLNLFCNVWLDGADVKMLISVGLPYEVMVAGLSLGGYTAFRGVIELGDALYDSLIDPLNDRQYTYFSIPTFSVDINVSDGQTIFKGNSNYTLGVVYYDEYLRKGTIQSKVGARIPKGQYESGPIRLEVRIDGEAPSWAKHYSLVRSKSSITDGELIHLDGGGFASLENVIGDTGSLFKEISLKGIKEEDTDNGVVYWKAVRSLGFGWVVELFNNPSGGIGTRIAVSERKVNYQYTIEDGVVYQKMKMVPVGTNVTGEITIKAFGSSATNVSNQKIQIVLQRKEEKDGMYSYGFDISNYVNTIRKSLDRDQNVYMPKVGDKVRLLKAGVVDKNILLTVEKIEEGIVAGEEGEDTFFLSYVIYCYPIEDDFNLTNGGVVEMFKEQTTDVILYEASDMYDVVFENGVYQHKGGDEQIGGGTILYTTDGDAYLRKREYVGTDGEVYRTELVETFRISDNYNSRVWGAGRPNVYDVTSKQKHLTTGLRHGGRVLTETLINDLSRYNSDDIIVLSPDYGAITRVVETPNAVKVICERRRETIDIGREVVTRPDGTEELVAISRVFGSRRPSMKAWGSKDFHSVVNIGTEVFYFDAINGQMLSDGQNGQFPISGKVMQGEYAHDYKMHSFFKRMVTARGGWDEGNRMLFVTGLVDGGTETVGFHRDTNRWISFYSFKPPMYMFTGIKMYTFSTRLYEHNVGVICNYYGKQYGSKVKMISTKNPLNMKIYDSVNIRVQGIENVPNDFMVLTIEPNDTYSRGMYSILTKGMFRLEEGEYRADVKRNMLTHSNVVSNNDLHNGERMRGYYLEMLVDFGSSDYKLMGTSVLQTISK